MNTNQLSTLHSLLITFERRFSRFSWLIPVISFSAGWASFVLVQRGEGLARIIALLAFLGWLWILAEPFITSRFLGGKHPKLSSNVAIFLSQSIQQEIYFFALPFLIAATQIRSIGQMVFTGTIIAVAVVSTVDPWYEKYIYRNRLVSFAYHALCSFVSALVILPIVVKLPTEKTLVFALGFLLFWLLLTIPKLLTQAASWRTSSVVCVALFLVPIFIWLARGSIPAAGLQATSAVITTNVIDHEPTDVIENIDSGSLSNGVYAFVAIRAPNGLAQDIVFEWRKGDYSETISAKITGGRNQGYRTYSMKSNFPKSVEGVWSVDVRTAQGQLLQHLQFVVTEVNKVSE